MDDITEKLKEMLSDEDSINKIKQLYELISENNDKKKNNQESSCSESKSDEQNCSETCSDDAPSFDFSLILKLQSLLCDNDDNKDTALLYALKPHLSEERQNKVDKAVKIIKLVNAAEILKDSGLINEII